MLSRPLLIQTLDLSDEQSEALARAAEIAYGKFGYEIQPCASPSAASKIRHTENRVLALANPSQSDLSQLVSETDDEELPLWVITAFDYPQPTNGVVPVSADKSCDANNASRLRLSVERHLAVRASERARGDLLTISARVCHDLRSPLNTIQTAIYLHSAPELPPGYSKEEITELAFDSIKAQNSLLGKVSAFTEASGRETPFEPISMERGFSDALDQTKRLLDAKNGSISPPDSWPTQNFAGVQSWIAIIWESFICALLSHNLCGNELEAGWNEEADDIVFWIRARSLNKSNGEERLRVIPFHLLHERHGSGDFGPALAHRFAGLQGGFSGVDEVNGYTCLYFGLPKQK